jgi:hypothetical protein
MSRSSLSQFPAANARAAAEHFPHAESGSLRVKKVVLILMSRANPGANPDSLLPRYLPAAF